MSELINDETYLAMMKMVKESREQGSTNESTKKLLMDIFENELDGVLNSSRRMLDTGINAFEINLKNKS